MNFKTYRLSILIILLILVTTTCAGIYISNNLALFMRISYVFMNTIQDDIYKKETPTGIHTNPIDIRNIISERYLYTFKKVIEKRYLDLSGTGLSTDVDYKSFSGTFLEGNNFVFQIQGIDIDIPTSSFYFDKWNNSGAILSGVLSQPIVRSSKKTIALTFDDGPSPKYTNKLLDILKSENVKVTFFVLGSNVTNYPEIVRREYREGHEIGNHSFSHTIFTKLSTNEINEELYKTDQAIYKAIGKYPTIFRPPYGATNTGVLNTIEMPAILWSIDSKDWSTHNKIKNIHSVDHAKDGDIIIMHDIHEESVESIPDIIKNLKGKGFEFVTVSDLLLLNSEDKQIGKKCTKKGSCK